MHIGHGKTGTTAIQNQLYAARHILKEGGIIYPEVGIPPAVGPILQTAHHWLCNNLNSNDKTGLDDLNAVRSKLTRIKNEADKLQAARVIISSELLCYANERLPKVYKEVFYDYRITVVYFIRRQDDLIKSAYLQAVKQGRDKSKPWGNSKSPLEFAKHGWRGFLFLNLADRWASVLGEENVRVILYHKKLAADSFAAFKHAIGLTLEPDPKVCPRPNIGILTEFVKLIDVMDNGNVDFDTRWKIIHELEVLSSTFRSQSAGLQDPDGWLDVLKGYYAENNMNLAKQFMGGQHLRYLTFESDEPLPAN